jgi:hypothetical protein
VRGQCRPNSAAKKVSWAKEYRGIASGENGEGIPAVRSATAVIKVAAAAARPAVVPGRSSGRGTGVDVLSSGGASRDVHENPLCPVIGPGPVRHLHDESQNPKSTGTSQ